MLKKIWVYLGLLCFVWSITACKLKTVKTRYDSGQLMERYTISKKDQSREGCYLMYHENGQIALQQCFAKGIMDGEEITYHENGQVNSVAIFENDQYNGPFVYYYEDGALHQEGQFVNNAIEGELKTYYPNGILKEIVSIKENNEDGPFTLFHENGRKKMEGTFLEGPNEHGVLQIYDTLGVLIEKKECEMGLCQTIWLSSDSTQLKED